MKQGQKMVNNFSGLVRVFIQQERERVRLSNYNRSYKESYFEALEVIEGRLDTIKSEVIFMADVQRLAEAFDQKELRLEYRREDWEEYAPWGHVICDR